MSPGGKEKQMGGTEELPRANQVARESKREIQRARYVCDRTIALLLASLSVLTLPHSRQPRDCGASSAGKERRSWRACLDWASDDDAPSCPSLLLTSHVLARLAQP